MLTRAHAIVVYERGVPQPDRLTRGRHKHYLAYAEAMLAIYREGAGRTRRDLHRAVERLFDDEPDCDPRRIHAFCKLLDDEAAYETGGAEASLLRLQVFARAAPHHPLVRQVEGLLESDEARVKEEVAQDLGEPWPRLEGRLYADVYDFHRLRAWEGRFDAPGLLARYNVGQLQACLFDAEAVTVDAGADFKTIPPRRLEARSAGERLPLQERDQAERADAAIEGNAFPLAPDLILAALGEMHPAAPRAASMQASSSPPESSSTYRNRPTLSPLTYASRVNSFPAT